jgi:hypothetical protein
MVDVDAQRTPERCAQRRAHTARVAVELDWPWGASRDAKWRDPSYRGTRARHGGGGGFDPGASSGNRPPPPDETSNVETRTIRRRGACGRRWALGELYALPGRSLARLRGWRRIMNRMHAGGPAAPHAAPPRPTATSHTCVLCSLVMLYTACQSFFCMGHQSTEGLRELQSQTGL